MLCLKHSHDSFDIMTVLPHSCFLPICVNLERRKKKVAINQWHERWQYDRFFQQKCKFPFCAETPAASNYRNSKCWISLFIVHHSPFPLLSYSLLFFRSSIYFYVVIYFYLFWDDSQGLHQLLNTVGYLIAALWVISELTKNGRIPLWPSVCQKQKQQTTAGKNMVTHWGAIISKPKESIKLQYWYLNVTILLLYITVTYKTLPVSIMSMTAFSQSPFEDNILK